MRAGPFLLRGRFVEGSAVEAFCDPTVCLFGAPEHVVQVTHPRPGGDLDTCVFLSEEVLDSMGESADCQPAPPYARGLVVARRLLALCSQDDTDSLAIEEAALSLFVAALAQAEPGAGAPAVRGQRLMRGEENLARVAADLGFADHAHLTRTMRRTHGQTPSSMRALISSHRGPSVLRRSEPATRSMRAILPSPRRD